MRYSGGRVVRIVRATAGLPKPPTEAPPLDATTLLPEISSKSVRRPLPIPPQVTSPHGHFHLTLRPDRPAHPAAGGPAGIAPPGVRRPQAEARRLAAQAAAAPG